MSRVGGRSTSGWGDACCRSALPTITRVWSCERSVLLVHECVIGESKTEGGRTSVRLLPDPLGGVCCARACPHETFEMKSEFAGERVIQLGDLD
jgi:hypothetical protein